MNCTKPVIVRAHCTYLLSSTVVKADTVSLCVCDVRLSRHARTVILSIHQPRFAIFQLFDRLTLLAAGNTVYHGKASEALDFFQTIGSLL